MVVKLTNSYLSGNIKAITSKSYAHRAMICDFILGKETDINAFNLSNDIIATMRCLSAIKKGENVLDAGESGSTLRFILPLVAVLGLEKEIKMSGLLPERPNDDLLECISKNGATFKRVGNSLYTKGRLLAGEYFIKADKSSQYLSGLIMALSSLKEKSVIKVTTPISSRPYVDITIEVLKSYGFRVLESDNTFIVGGEIENLSSCLVEGDWSNSAFFLVAGAINGEICVTGLNANSVQGDRKILEVLKSANAKIVQDGDCILVKKSNLKAFNLSAQDCPDLVPICAVLGAYAKGVTKIFDIERLKLKESDRIISTIEMLTSCGIKAQVCNEVLTIYGGEVTGGVINSYNDHRIVMAGAVLSLLSKGEVTILNAQAVNKSYPEFFKDFTSIGGKVNAEI